MNEVDDGRLVRPPKKIQGLVNAGKDKSSWCHNYAQHGRQVLLWFEDNRLHRIDFCRDIEPDELTSIYPEVGIVDWTEPLETELAAVILDDMRQAENAMDYHEFVEVLVEAGVRKWAEDRRGRRHAEE